MWIWWWWLIWLAVIFFVLFLPLGYGWSRWDWGPPYPSYYRRRWYRRDADGALRPDPRGDIPVDEPDPGWQRTATATVTQSRAEDGTTRAARWLADLFWLAILAWIGWAVYLWVT